MKFFFKKITIILISFIFIFILFDFVYKDKSTVQTVAEIHENNNEEIKSILIDLRDETLNDSEIHIIPSKISFNELYIKINYTANVLTVYDKKENGELVPLKAFICSTGSATPRSGVYKLKQYKNTWVPLFGGVYGQYGWQITGNILLHSVPYLRNGDKSSLRYWDYDRLGTRASSGCIRLTVEDAKWIYDNCYVGTEVEFYGSSDPGPLGKPESQKISSNYNLRGWDPTDPDPNNPWKN